MFLELLNAKYLNLLNSIRTNQKTMVANREKETRIRIVRSRGIKASGVSSNFQEKRESGSTSFFLRKTKT